jgi:phage gp36-like protein
MITGVYTTEYDLKTRVGPAVLESLLDATGQDRVLVVTDLITQAEGMVNGYAFKLYTLPIPVSPAVKSLCLDIMEYYLHKRASNDDVNKKYKDSYDEAKKTLVDMAKGDWIPPPDVNGAETTSKRVTGNSMSIVSDVPLFSEAKFYGTSYVETDYDD